jgi:hypothetical protein
MLKSQGMARCLLMMVLAVCSGRAGGLPERARAGHAGSWLHPNASSFCRTSTSRLCASGGSGPPSSRLHERKWGEIEQKCDHFTRASWTPEKKHMRHDMMREEGIHGRTAEGHVNAFSCRLKQRYWMHTSEWDRPVGPVLLVVGGESPVDGAIDGFVLEIAFKLKALVVVVEHRFFGKSIPEGWNASNGLGLLTMQQAVADLAVFRDKFQRTVLAPEGQSESVWITVGCGYAGALATWAHAKYPQHFVGVWASSPPLLPAVEFSRHDIHDREAVGHKCGGKIRTLTDILEIELNNMGPGGPSRLKSLFKAPQELTDSDFRLVIHDSISLAIQHGFKRRLCGTLDNATSDDDLMPAFADLTHTLWGSSFASSCHFDTKCLSSVEKVLSSSRALHWLQCTQLGTFPTAPRGEEDLGIRHKGIDASFFMRRCVAAFGKGTRTDPHGARATFKGSGENKLLVVAKDDAWKHLVPRDTNAVLVEADCESCGQCFDMLLPRANNEEELTAARAKILSHLHDTVRRHST